MSEIIELSRYALPILTVIILALSVAALLRRKNQPLGNVRLINTINGDSYEITGRETSVGCFKDCDIILNYPTVAKHHAVIKCGRDSWSIIPVSSDAPVSLNSSPVEKSAIITAGDRITLGKIDLLFMR
ncbi:MAG: FHA domain-containing protein [Clostridia bacterium]|jgi:pSer/pThr/pTyr-binding forkhead associated (FHA) protein|nr:FHA domain-containing protein [Clostridia bacterium]MBR6701838.1 FHA domain-containing protein [Clostridia bacterium]